MSLLLLFLTIFASCALAFYALVWVKLIHFAATRPALFALYSPPASLVWIPLVCVAFLIARVFA